MSTKTIFSPLIAGIFLLCIETFSVGQEIPTAEISLGKLEGYYKTSYDGRQFKAFEGIPYAKPPLDDLRFEPPQEAEPWMGILKANKIYTCTQAQWLSGMVEGSEDCLYLNVYVPENAKDLDVMVHIHGGAFMMGTPDYGGPGYLMDRNIVYVTINYRLGPFGFLSTEDNVVSGNMGLKDQTMALCWIQKHIKNFGGNPNSVTISGSSAGAASVHLHYFSPLSRGLFHKGISQGGTALAPWAIHLSPLKLAKKLAATVGCDNPSTAEMIACMKKQTNSDLTKNVYGLSGVNNFPLTPFAPVIEKNSSGAFLSECLYKLLDAGEIANAPWITGTVTEEGILGLMGFFFKYDYMNENWDNILDTVLNYYDVIDNTDKRAVAQTIKKFYIKGENVNDDNVDNFIKLFGDRFFYLSMEEAARLQAKSVSSPVYAYMYGYKHSQQDELMKAFGVSRDYGVGHGSDAFLLYTVKCIEDILKPNLNKDDIKIKELLLDVVTSFAKSGEPVINGIEWNPVTADSDDFNYLSISNNEIKPMSKPELADKSFWKSLPFKNPIF